jgi:outer membrane lipoprotein carrier protein
MIKSIQTIVILFCLSVWSLSSFAEEGATEKLSQFVEQVVTFKAKFEQTVMDVNGMVSEKAEGYFELERPGKFRWDYISPYPQHIVADGQKIWFYDVDLEQVTVKSQLETLADTPASLLSGEALPEDTYLLTDLPSEDGLYWVELVPKDLESNFQIITLAFDNNSLQQMIMRDAFGQKTRLVFTQVSENPDFDNDEFKFVPPQGVDVVGDTSQ